MIRAGDPALPENAADASYAIREADRRMRATMRLGTELKYKHTLGDIQFTFEVVSIGPEPLHLEVRMKQMDIGEKPVPPFPSSPIIPQHHPDPKVRCEYLAGGMCYWCCPDCNTDSHRCPGCGTPVDHNGNESNGEKHADCTA